MFGTTPVTTVADALHSGRLNFAIGVLPLLQGIRSHPIAKDRYRVVVRKQHPLADLKGNDADVRDALKALNFVAVSTHSETTQLLRLLGLEYQRSPNILLIPGTSSLIHLRENLAAVN